MEIKFRVTFKRGLDVISTIDGITMVVVNEQTVNDLGPKIIEAEHTLELLTGYRVHIEQQHGWQDFLDVLPYLYYREAAMSQNFEAELLRCARNVTRMQGRARRLRKELKQIERDLRVERRHLRAMSSKERAPDVAPSRVFGGAVGLKAPRYQRAKRTPLDNDPLVTEI